MSNPKSKTAAAFTKEKLASGQYKQFSVQGRAEDIDAILAAVEKAGGSRTQALVKICSEWLERAG